jgi:outer membrane protein assembly factor BamB
MLTNWKPAFVVVLLFVFSANANADNWPQFRGPNASGRAARERPLPTAISLDKSIWKTELPPGHSSPAIFGDRIYVTAERDKKLWTICLNRTTGDMIWEAEAKHETLEPIHNIGSHAQASPAADGDIVVSFFGSCGMFCYYYSGKFLWSKPMGPFKNDFGAGSSPIIVGDRILLCQDHDTDSFLMSIDKRTGREVWKTDRSEFPRNYCTPVIWEVNGKKQIVVAATLRIVGYDFETGKEVWTVRGIARIINMTPVVGDDGNLYAACWSPGADETDKIQTVPFDEVAVASDKNKNGSLEQDELSDGPIKQRFSQIDRDKSGSITREEYESMRRVFETARNVVLAIKPGGTGDITDTHVLWQYNRMIPYCPSPLFYNGLLFMVRNGGIFTALDAKTGQPTKQGRVAATGDYYSSPVAGDGKLYLLSQKGQLTVVSAQREWEQLSSTDFKEPAYATPAIADGRIYVRTNGHLYCFGTE